MENKIDKPKNNSSELSLSFLLLKCHHPWKGKHITGD